MTQAGVDIDRIVREVVRRLRSVDAPVGPVGPTGPAAGTGVTPTQRLTIQDSVVTLATLKGRLNGAQQVAVDRRAVVTPAVKDELRERGIALVRGDDSATAITGKHVTGNGSAGQLALGIAVEGVCGSSLSVALTQQVEILRVASEPQLLDQLVHRVTQSVRQAVILTSSPAAAAAMANRHSGIRAAAGSSFPAVRQAMDQLGANLLAIDPLGKQQSELAALINEFTRGGPAACPPQFAAQLS